MVKTPIPTIACQLIIGTVAERSLFAERMATQAEAIRCTEHNLFHSWVPVEGETKRDLGNRAYAVRFDAYHEISPGRWVLREARPTKKSKKGRKSVTDSDDSDLD